jgi:hypothetical protein
MVMRKLWGRSDGSARRKTSLTGQWIRRKLRGYRLKTAVAGRLGGIGKQSGQFGQWAVAVGQLSPGFPALCRPGGSTLRDSCPWSPNMTRSTGSADWQALEFHFHGMDF